jgi:hypothetical protein
MRRGCLVELRVAVMNASKTVGLAAIAIALVSGCKSSTPQQTAPLGDTTSSSSGGDGGSGGSGGATSSGTTKGDGGASTSSTHSSSTAASTAGSGGTGGATDVWTCNQDQGFWAMSTGFTSPTMEPLAEALNELGYDDDAHPISFIVHAGSSVTAALSATVAGANGDVFPANEAPSFAALVPTQGEGVTTVDAQDHAFLHFTDMSGPVDIEIDHLVFTATETFSCNQVFLDISAVLPASNYATVLHLADGDVTVGDLVRQQTTPAPEVHLTFRGQPMTFDFSSL